MRALFFALAHLRQITDPLRQNRVGRIVRVPEADQSLAHRLRTIQRLIDGRNRIGMFLAIDRLFSDTPADIRTLAREVSSILVYGIRDGSKPVLS